MQDLLTLEDVIPSLPLTIECIASFMLSTTKKYRIFVSTKEKHLLVYTLNRAKIDAQTKLERTIKLKAVIDHMRVYLDGGVLLSLADSKFTCRDLNSPDVELGHVLAQVRNVTSFGVIIEEMKSSSGQSTSLCQLCLVQKRKLMVYYWNKIKFRHMREFTLDEIPRAVCWLNFSVLVISAKTGYMSINIDKSNVTPIDIVDRAQTPNIVHFGAQSVLWLVLI